MLITRAPCSTAQRIARASTSMSIVPSPSTTFATSSSADGAMPGDALGVVDAGGDQAGDERAVALLVLASGAADEALRVDDPASELGVAASTPESITATRTGGEQRQLGPEVEGAVRRQVPLLRDGSFGTQAGGGRRAARRRSRREAPEPRSGARSTTTAGSGARLSPRAERALSRQGSQLVWRRRSRNRAAAAGAGSATAIASPASAADTSRRVLIRAEAGDSTLRRNHGQERLCRDRHRARTSSSAKKLPTSSTRLRHRREAIRPSRSCTWIFAPAAGRKDGAADSPRPAAVALTSGATGTSSTGPATVPAESRKPSARPASR